MSNTATITYDDKSVRHFMNASIFWGIIGMIVGVLAATQLSWWQMNGKFLEAITFGLVKSEGLSYITFGRIRPLHTNAVIFAFVGNMVFAGVYYSTQRLCRVRTASDLLSKIHFWGWQLIIVGAAVTLPAGLTRGKEYAELIWPLNIAVVVIWVVFGLNFFLTLARRNERSLYVSLWFYIATIVTIAMLYIVNHLSLPTSLLHSYPIFGGVQDGLVQWWYGHNAVAFFLTTPILGIMYYFIPKAADRPVYSYRLSIIHFWALVFIYIWAGPHHLLNTALPRWLQMLGMLFSVMLWAPSWAGMLNGLLTLRGAWDKLRTDPVIKFFAAAVTFYGMATFEGPLLSIRAVNALSHYTDWTVGHVHSGALGWNGFMAAGMFYWLAPRLWRTKLWSTSLANMHFWVGLVGILLYVASMWVAGIMQGLMLAQTNPDGATLKYEFVETLNSINIYYGIRSFGGFLFLVGFLLCAVNIFMTARKGVAEDETVEVTLLGKATKDRMTLAEALSSDPVVHAVLALAFMILWFLLPPHADKAALAATVLLVIKSISAFRAGKGSWNDYFNRLLENYLPFTVLIFAAAAVGGVVQIIPSLLVNRAVNVEDRVQVPYTPLELAGRDIYVAEGCYNCHSQMIRTLVPDVLRYGPGEDQGYSRLGESIYDHPYQWGSKRTGPDLAREGGALVKDAKLMRSGKRDNLWHFTHFLDPRQMSSGSNMPAYPWLFGKKAALKELPAKIAAQARLGVPWPAMTKDEIEQNARDQALEIASSLVTAGAFLPDKPDLGPEELRRHLSETQVVALIAYIQKIGVYAPVEKPPVKNPTLDPDAHRTTSTH
ncbi:cytochrome-c oxidase, cbb3-type subunit I [Luteolibacter sp. SL250]|uniref:cytochrome-c oxidase, cbb3-type subunit I n=1 Tax=Luteolibacter sp. SL250 TaxID=2995170 RepID=UPI0022721821|nr:cytochrome-c oxidase, cbb3-type subunit I [Luteolibacter sp. SL250]WAC21408.1 cytochrome-c oxidase, cbb3-type subunit I [Luteolibacter sp. SL250]